MAIKELVFNFLNKSKEDKYSKKIPPYGYGKKKQLISYTTKDGKIRQRWQIVGWQNKPLFNIPKETVDTWDINNSNPLLSTNKITGEPVKKFAINLKTKEFLINPKYDSHARHIAEFGEASFDDYVRGIYDAKNNIVGLRTVEGDLEKRFNTYYDVFQILKVNNEDVLVAADVGNEDLDAAENFDIERYKLNKGKTAMIFNDKNDPEYHKVQYELFITPNMETFSDFEDFEKIINKEFDSPRFRNFIKDAQNLANKYNVKINSVERILGKYENTYEPSFVFTFTGSKKDITRIGVILGQKYKQKEVIFSRKAELDERDPDGLCGSIIIDKNSKPLDIAKMLSDNRIENYSFNIDKNEVLIFGNRALINRFINDCEENNVLVDAAIKRNMTTFVNQNEYIDYVKGAKIIKAFESEDDFEKYEYSVVFLSNSDLDDENEKLNKLIWKKVFYNKSFMEKE